MIIDSHTHIYDKKIYQDYFTKARGKILKTIVMSWWKLDLEELIQFASQKDNLYIIGNIDMTGEIDKELKKQDKLFQQKKIFGIKLYPGYQYFYPSDEKVYSIAELCQKYNKPLVFHSGDVYNPENDALLKYSHPSYIDELAVKFPKCKIVISHFGFPYHLETANIVSKNENVYTEISGTLDECESDKEAKDMLNQYIKDLRRVFFYFPNVRAKTMFGTDYGGEHTPLRFIEPYIKVVKSVFSEKEQEVVSYKLAERLFLKK